MEAETLNKIRTLAEEGYSARYIIAMLKLPADVFEKDAEAAEHYAVGLQQNNKPDDEIEAEAESVSANRGGRRIAYTSITLEYEYRRAFSEVQLMEAIGSNGFHFEEGKCYVFISNGDVGSLSFLKAVLMQQDVEHLICSTWCMACQDILMMDKWISDGRIQKMDIYVGEIFKGSYHHEYTLLKDLYERRPELGRMAIFRNHSKVFSGKGKDFSFSIISSANINTNPRCEATAIIIDPGSYSFFKDFFDGINSFE